MASLDFPTNPSIDDTYSAGGKTWVWNGESWLNNSLAQQASLNDLTDVSANTPSDGQVLTYNSNTSLWESQDPTGGGITTGKAIAMAIVFG